MVASDKLFYCSSSSTLSVCSPWSRFAAADGGLLEAQMAADPGFLLRLNAETVRLLQQKGRQAEAVGISLRLLEHRCGTLTASQQARIPALSLSALGTLSVALLDFQGPEDLNTWLNRPPPA